jgi:predicted acetyltransferase
MKDNGKIGLEAAGPVPPLGLAEFIADLGAGEGGFSGTPVHRGEMSIDEYLRKCADGADPEKLPPGAVPQTVYWILDRSGLAVGMLKLRHILNDALRFDGGHIGYFIRRDRRGRGYGGEALRLGLLELARRGVNRALLMVDFDNLPSIKIIEGRGGRFDSLGVDPRTKKEFRRYWIDLGPAGEGREEGSP